MMAATVKSLWDVYQDSPEVLNTGNLSTLLIGCVVAFIVAILAIKFFISYLQKNGFRIFGIYRIILGIILFILIAAGNYRSQNSKDKSQKFWIPFLTFDTLIIED